MRCYKEEIVKTSRTTSFISFCALVGCVGLALLLSGCISVSYPKTSQEASTSLKLETGYDGCSKCDKVKTYSIGLPSIDKSFGVGQDGGWMHLSARLQWTNNLPENEWGFRLVVKQTNSGFYMNGIQYWLSNEAGSLISPLYAKHSDGKCFANIGSGCSWTDTIAIPARHVLGAAKSDASIYVFVGKTTQETITLNDGYKPFEIYKNRKHGVLYRIPAYAIQGFLVGLSREGIDATQIAGVQDNLNAKKLQTALEKEQEKNRQSISLINPLPQKVASEWIAKQSEGAVICSYMQGTYQRATGSSYNGIPLYGLANATTFRVTASLERYNPSNKRVKVLVNRITGNALGEEFPIDTLTTPSETYRANQSLWSDLAGWKPCQQ